MHMLTDEEYRLEALREKVSGATSAAKQRAELDADRAARGKGHREFGQKIQPSRNKVQDQLLATLLKG